MPVIRISLEISTPDVRKSTPIVLYDAARRRLYASLWGSSEVAVLDAGDGRVLARWPVGLHPNELLLAPDGRRLFVANGGRNSVTVLDAESGLSGARTLLLNSELDLRTSAAQVALALGRPIENVKE